MIFQLPGPLDIEKNVVSTHKLLLVPAAQIIAAVSESGYRGQTDKNSRKVNQRTQEVNKQRGNVAILSKLFITNYSFCPYIFFC